MSKSLKERLEDTKDVFAKVGETLNLNPGSLLTTVDEEFKAISDCTSHIEHLLTMADARAVAWQFLEKLKADSDGFAQYNDVRVKFVHVRLIAVQAYVATNWSLADSVTGLAGRLVCTHRVASDQKKSVKLPSHFIREERNNSTAGLLDASLFESYGWPVEISYAIRNAFVHDGGQKDTSNFFEPSEPAQGFRISDVGWKDILNSLPKAVTASQKRPGVIWPINPQDDLREVLRVCERETDDALGVLIGSSCHAFRAHVAFMLGMD